MGIAILCAALLGSTSSITTAEGPLLFRTPAIGPKTIVFAFAGDLWSVPREGGDAVRLTSTPTLESGPVFSPDGKNIAFTSQADGNPEVYVMPAEGGPAKRLTYFSGLDLAVSWTPDSKRVVFRSMMRAFTLNPQIYSVSLDGEYPEQIPFPIANSAAMAPDGRRVALVPHPKWQTAWKRYRGGNASRIFIGSLADSKVEEVPGRGKAEDSTPMWVGNKLYFLSDRTAGKMGIWRYDGAGAQPTEIIKGQGLDIRSASAGFGAIAYEKLGSLRTYDLATKEDREIPISIRSDFPEARPQFKQVGVSGLSISPTAVRLAVQARGHILSMPIKQGDPRDITPEQGVANRNPAWSPDGKTIAYFSDAGGEYRLILHDSNGPGVRTIVPGNAPAFYFTPVWSPDSKKIAYTDNRHLLWVLDVASGVSEKVDEGTYEDPTRDSTPSWSPDSKWLTWHRDLATQFNAIFVYNVETKQKTQITDGLADAKYPCFDLGGDYLYFVASTDTGGGTAWLDLTALQSTNRSSSLYCAVLKNDGPDPLAATSDEEPDANSPKAPPKAEVPFRIDLENIDQRIIALPSPARNIVSLHAGTTGSVFMIVAPYVGVTPTSPPLSLNKFDLESKQTTPFARNVFGFDFTPKNDKVLLIQGGELALVPTAAPPAPGQGVIRSATMPVKIDPIAEWAQIFRESVRLQRDYFYDPGHHGQDMNVLEERYKPFLAGLKSRADLNYLFDDMMGEISVGHMYIGGGDLPAAQGPAGGLLGADFKIEKGRYLITRVYNGESWNAEPRPPLARPGVNAKAGEYVLAIDGTELTEKSNIFAALEGKAGRLVRVKIGAADGSNSRVVLVEALATETDIRRQAWIEDNRRTVARLSDGKLGYVHVPDTGLGGWTNFNRFFFSQRDREGFVIDERFNGGGSVDDYMVEQMSRPLMSMWTSRYGKDFASPAAGHFGPKVLLINEFAGSGGDYFPWAFRKKQIGPIIGRRTWGGLVGILNFPEFVDGGRMTSPNIAFYNPDGKWEIENEGISPDFAVEMDPFLWRQGRDAQLEKGVEVALARLKDWKNPNIRKPAYQDKSKIGG